MNVVIVGGGKVGLHLATMLTAGGKTVRLVEEKPEIALSLEGTLTGVAIIEGNGADPLILEQAGIKNAEVLAAVTGNDATNLVTAGLARAEFRVPRIIARVNDPQNTWLFIPEMGVDVALNQADLLAHLITEEMSVGEMMTLLKLRKGEFSLVEEKVHPSSVCAGKAIKEIAFPAASVITAVIRAGKLLIPRGDVALHAGDEVLAVVHSTEVANLAALLGPVIQPQDHGSRRLP